MCAAPFAKGEWGARPGHGPSHSSIRRARDTADHSTSSGLGRRFAGERVGGRQ
jgi:hypothetical protein